LKLFILDGSIDKPRSSILVSAQYLICPNSRLCTGTGTGRYGLYS
jgi:hypothetical protein